MRFRIIFNQCQFNKSIKSLLIIHCSLLISCPHRPLTSLTPNSTLIKRSVQAEFCIQGQSQELVKKKYLFLIDHSASNASTTDTLSADNITNSDPSGAVRYTGIEFFNTQQTLLPLEDQKTSYINIARFGTSTDPCLFVGQNAVTADPTARPCANVLVPSCRNLPAYSINLSVGGPSDPTQPTDILTSCDNNSGCMIASQFVPWDTPENRTCILDTIQFASASSTHNPINLGYTNYQSVLNYAYLLIQKDLQNEYATASSPIMKSLYQIILVSDGLPFVSSGYPPVIINQADTTPRGGAAVSNWSAYIQPAISNLLSLKQKPIFQNYIHDIQLNTVFYTNKKNPCVTTQCPPAVALRNIANAGNGLFIDYTKTSLDFINYTPFQTSSNVSDIYNLSQVFVENINAVWRAGKLKQDSDADGIPDEQELAYGSNPYQKDSDGNGISDLVEEMISQRPCKDPQCSPSNRYIYPQCDGFLLSPKPIPIGYIGPIVYMDSDLDGLNDCEEQLIQSDRNNFTTNPGNIPDFLALKNGITIKKNTENLFNIPFGDGLNLLQKIILGLPTDQPAGNEIKRVNTLKILTKDINQTCYSFTVDNLRVTAIDNKIQVTVIQNSLGKTYRVKKTQTEARTWEKDQSLLSFNPSDFK